MEVMHWKRLPRWLRGGVIGIALFSALAGLNSLCINQFPPGYLAVECTPFELGFVPFIPLFLFIQLFVPTLSSSQVFVGMFLLSFATGSLLGGTYFFTRPWET